MEASSKLTEVTEHIILAQSNKIWNKYIRNQELIEIDITYACNLKCFNCNRSCTQAPTEQKMNLEQIYKFVNESIRNKIQWKTIRILGGEPSLHSQLLLILDLLTEYRKDFSHQTMIQLVTNGFGKEVNHRLSQVSSGITIENSYKISRIQTQFSPFNLAPIDLAQFKDYDFSGGCWIASVCGIGLTPFGYYPCAIAGGIDRIFGFDKGRKNLPDPDDGMLDLFSMFCRFCGHFLENQRPLSHEKPNYVAEHSEKDEAILKTECEILSPTWITAYDNYRQKPPELTTY
jgi:hypothetical protein